MTSSPTRDLAAQAQRIMQSSDGLAKAASRCVAVVCGSSPSIDVACEGKPGLTRYHAWYGKRVWSVVYLPEAGAELGDLPAAVRHAVEKLQSLGPQLRFPHQSDVRGADDLRELRPRQGRSPWRPLYRRIGDTFVIGAIGPEAKKDPGGFGAACFRAEQRLAKVEDG